VSRRGQSLAESGNLHSESGAVLVLALLVLVVLTTLAVALLSIGASEPQISRNHADMLRARYLAEAGVEHALDMLAQNPGSWDLYLTSATCSAGAVLIQSTLPGAPDGYGEFTVRIRNDCAPGDDRSTGAPLEDVVNATSDTNGKVIVTSAGAVERTAHTVAVVISRNVATPPLGQSDPSPRVTTRSWADI
jgi:Tfp pilus assembly protein PilX